MLAEYRNARVTREELYSKPGCGAEAGEDRLGGARVLTRQARGRVKGFKLCFCEEKGLEL